MIYKQFKHIILSKDPLIVFYNEDCMDIMNIMQENEYPLCICDPPYGISINANMGRKKGKAKRHSDVMWDNDTPTPEYFKELFRVAKNTIIWGGNYFDLPPNKHFIFWDKLVPEDLSFSDGEYAWTSFDRAIKKFTLRNVTGGKIHPTQKPVKLYEWLLKNYAKEGDRILDTHLGSGSSAIAAYNYKHDFVGIEIDEDYYQAAVKRFNQHEAQTTLF